MSENHENEQKNGGGLKWLAGLPLAVAGSWIGYSKLFVNHNVPLPDAIPAQRVVYAAKTGVNLNYYVDRRGDGRPLVLIHSINAAASAYEMGPLFQHFRQQRPVFALDLPGFGFSDRPDRVYSPAYYAESILDFLESQVQEAADVVALSLGSEFAARAAQARPELFHSLACISPSGLNKMNSGRASQRARMNGGEDRIYNVLANPLWEQPLYDLLTTRRSIQYYLNQSFVGPTAPGIVDYAYATGHQPGAKNAPLYFLSGRLFTPDIRTRTYEKLQIPALIIYDRDPFVRFDMLPELLQRNPNWQEARVVPSLGLPQFEKLPETAEALNNFWRGIA